MAGDFHPPAAVDQLAAVLVEDVLSIVRLREHGPPSANHFQINRQESIANGGHRRSSIIHENVRPPGSRRAGQRPSKRTTAFPIREGCRKSSTAAPRQSPRTQVSSVRLPA